MIKALAKLHLDARRGFLLPDNHIDWFLPACWAGRLELCRQRYDMIYTTVPPYTSGLVAAYLSRWSGLPLVLDIRDPWLDRTAPGAEHRTHLHRSLDLALERYVVRQARKLTFIYQIGLDQYLERYPERARDMMIVRPGFDFERDKGKAVSPLAGKVTLAYAGHVYPPYSSFRKLVQLLVGCDRQGMDLTLGLWGCEGVPMVNAILKEENFTKYVISSERLSLQDIFAVEQEVTANVMLLNFNTIPTKLYELLAAGQKIIYVGPRVEELETLLAQYSAHHFSIYLDESSPSDQDIQRLKEFLLTSVDSETIAEKKKLVKKELSAWTQTRKLAALLEDAAVVSEGKQ
jgi:hypothetical protein